MAYVFNKTEYEVRWQESVSLGDFDQQLADKVHVEPDYMKAKKFAYNLIMGDESMYNLNVTIHEIQRREERVEEVTKESIEEALAAPFLKHVEATTVALPPQPAPRPRVAAPDLNDDIPF